MQIDDGCKWYRNDRFALYKHAFCIMCYSISKREMQGGARKFRFHLKVLIENVNYATKNQSYFACFVLFFLFSFFLAHFIVLVS